MPSYSTQDISLAALMGQFPAALPFGSVRIQFSGPPGSLQAEVPSVESAGTLVVDSIVQNEGNGWAGSGGNPWHLDNDTESIAFLTNASDQPAHIGFRVTANGGPTYFLTELLLNPHETRAIDIRKLRDAQKPDFRKNLIPAGATDGSVNWGREENLPVMGRLMQIHRKAGMVSNYDCGGSCPCPFNYTPSLNYMSPGTLYEAVNNNVNSYFYAGYQDCNYLYYYYNYTTSASWSSQNPSIASIQSAGLVRGVSAGATSVSAAYSGYTYRYNGTVCIGTYPVPGSGSSQDNVTPHITSISPALGPVGGTTTVTITGIGFGTSPTVQAGSGVAVNVGTGGSDTSITAYFAINPSAPGGNHSVTVTANQQTSNSVSFFVQVPTVAVIYSDTGVSEATCPLIGGGTGCGSARKIKWQFKDQQSTPQPINAALDIYDVVAIGSPNDFNVQVSQISTTCPNNSGPCDVYTDSNGISQLDVNSFCSSTCISSGACINPSLRSVFTQTWHANSVSVQPHTYTFTCGDVQIDGHD